MADDFNLAFFGGKFVKYELTSSSKENCANFISGSDKRDCLCKVFFEVAALSNSQVQISVRDIHIECSKQFK